MIIEIDQLAKMLRQNRPPALLVTTANVAAMLGISRAKFYQMLASNEIGPRPTLFGTAKRWRVDELTEWVKADCPGREQWQKMLRQVAGGT